MGQLQQKMIEDLQLRRIAPATSQAYIRYARQFVRYHRKSPTQLGAEHVREFLLHIASDARRSASTQNVVRAALTFLFAVTLERPEVVAGLPRAKVPHRVPTILSGSEVMAVLAEMKSLMHRAVVMTTYGAGLRINEACRLKVDDIDSARMVIRIQQGKGGRDRYVPLPRRVLMALREYWIRERPKGPQLFPGAQSAVHVHAATVRMYLKEAVSRTGITKRVTPHILRHTFATHLLELGTDIRVIQMLLGHRCIRSTARYVQVTPRILSRTKIPIDVSAKIRLSKLG